MLDDFTARLMLIKRIGWDQLKELWAYEHKINSWPKADNGLPMKKGYQYSPVWTCGLCRLQEMVGGSFWGKETITEREKIIERFKSDVWKILINSFKSGVKNEFETHGDIIFYINSWQADIEARHRIDQIIFNADIKVDAKKDASASFLE